MVRGHGWAAQIGNWLPPGGSDRVLRSWAHGSSGSGEDACSVHHQTRHYLIRDLPIRSDSIVYFSIMDLTDPTRSVTSTLDGPVLAVLAQAGKPMTVGEVAAQTPRGSEIGVRRSLARLVEQGIVRGMDMGRNRVHELNREHVAAPVAEGLAGLRLTLWKRFRATLSAWNPGASYGCVFGSAARGGGDTRSDIDLLVVRAPLAGRTRARPRGPHHGAGA